MINTKARLIEEVYSCVYDFLVYEEYDIRKGICLYLNRNSWNVLTTSITLTDSGERPTLEELQKKKYKYCSVIGDYYMRDYPDAQRNLVKLRELYWQIEERISDFEREYSFEKKAFEQRLAGLYSEFLAGLSETEKNSLRGLKAALLTDEREVVGVLDQEWDNLPCLNDFLPLWYVGEENSPEKPYIFATYSKDIAVKQAGGDLEKISQVLIEKKCKLLPNFLFDEANSEKEVILKASYLRKMAGPVWGDGKSYFVYK